MAKTDKGYGKRYQSEEYKDVGHLGEIRMPNNRDVMTEVSVGEPKSKEIYRPAITPGIHPADLNYIRETGKVPEDVYATSKKFAKDRIKEGKSPFYESEKGHKKGGKISIKRIRGNGIEKRGKTKGRFV
jgi:hypothetical protein